MSVSLVIGDWGSTRMRLWRLERGEIAERLEGPGILACGDPAATLASVMDGRTADRVVLCGSDDRQRLRTGASGYRA